ncbi:RND family efflux transporter, MFP subunit [Nitrosospira sp. Nsp14]|uniref:efflux RND transporter periplasmic adaptor subunit n=1 Tax=Nitrosospira sp. Nsp14 TaxID=1855333 RepID=UPI0008E69D45|nr:efflux RND transporter periplasmic adaptor subunit [Nitrosospira sp. Nsp14]SFH39427.1 RND family efflux transporter, MFP subunit [Nitrosospira sp. Nsp14]
MPPDTSVPNGALRQLRLAGIVAAVIVLIIVVAGLSLRASDSEQLRNWTEEQAIPSVVIIKPGKQGDTPTLDLPGRLEAYSRASLYARVSGYLKSWKVDIGTPVKAGQLLAEIEAPDLDQQLLQGKADLASARANASLAEITAARWQLLVKQNYVSKQVADEKTGDFLAKQALANSAQANLDRLQALKNFTRIVAPFDGLVTARRTDIGALINAGSGVGQELFEVSKTDTLRVYVNVPQTYVPSIPPGAKARITVPERPGKVYAAAVAASAQAVNIASGATLMQILVDNANGELLPGAFANISFDLPHNFEVLSVPASALMFDKAGLRVATVGPDSRVILKVVTIMRDLGKLIELSSGLAPDDRVIETPPDGIAEGDLVRIAGTPKKAGGVEGSSE